MRTFTNEPRNPQVRSNRAAIGMAVRDRLSAAAGVVRVPVACIDIFVLREFLDKSDCDALMALIESSRKPSRLLSDHSDSDFRTSETCHMDPGSKSVRSLETRLGALLGIKPKYGEMAQGQRYAVGQQFKPHHDFLRPSEPYWRRQDRIGGQRTWTAMIYLNVPEKGGETYFPRADVRILPRRGSLVAWNNLDVSGVPNPYSLHQGMPVAAGLKYIVTKWYRERPWGIPLAES